MVFSITERCNYTCSHCLVNATNEGNDAGLKVVNAVIKMVKRYNIRCLVVTGGEPTIHHNFFKVLELLLQKLSKECFIVVATNGSFLDNPSFIIKYIPLIQKYHFYTQITAVPNLYENAEKTIKEFNAFKLVFPNESERFEIIKDMKVIDNYGRAKGKDFSFLGDLYQRKSTNCHNVFMIRRETENFDDFFSLYQHLSSDNCKPRIDSSGDIFAGESIECVKIGNILSHDMKSIFSKLKNSSPCEKCGDFKINFKY